MTDFAYDVAFSFLNEDEGIAKRIKSFLAPGIPVFLYSERQKELAGADGAIRFDRLFGTEALTVFVLYREKWGETPWTRVEATAIRNRAFETGFEFLTVAPIGESTVPPKWLPKTRLWFDLKRFGPKAAAAVIEARLQELRGTPREETVEEAIEATKARSRADAERRGFLRSEAGVTLAWKEVNDLFSRLKKVCEENSDGSLSLKVAESARDSMTVVTSGVSLRITWVHVYSNTLDASELLAEFFEGVPPGLAHRYLAASTTLTSKRYSFDRVELAGGWRSSSQEFLTSETLVSRSIKELLRNSEAHRARK